MYEFSSLHPHCLEDCGPRGVCWSDGCTCDGIYLVGGPECSTPLWGAFLQLACAVLLFALAGRQVIQALRLHDIRVPPSWPQVLRGLKGRRSAPVSPSSHSNRQAGGAGDATSNPLTTAGNAPSGGDVEGPSPVTVPPPPPPSAEESPTLTDVIIVRSALSGTLRSSSVSSRQAELKRMLTVLKTALLVHAIAAALSPILIALLPFVPSTSVVPVTLLLLITSTGLTWSDALVVQMTLLILLQLSMNMPAYYQRQRHQLSWAAMSITPLTFMIMTPVRLTLSFWPYDGLIVADALMALYRFGLWRLIGWRIHSCFTAEYAKIRANNENYFKEDAERRTAQHRILQTLSAILGVTLRRLFFFVGSYVVLILAYTCWRPEVGRPVIPIQIMLLQTLVISLISAAEASTIARLLSVRGGISGTTIAPDASSVDMFEGQSNECRESSGAAQEDDNRWTVLMQMELKPIFDNTAQLDTIWERRGESRGSCTSQVSAVSQGARQSGSITPRHSQQSQTPDEGGFMQTLYRKDSFLQSSDGSGAVVLNGSGNGNNGSNSSRSGSGSGAGAYTGSDERRRTYSQGSHASSGSSASSHGSNAGHGTSGREEDFTLY